RRNSHWPYLDSVARNERRRCAANIEALEIHPRQRDAAEILYHRLRYEAGVGPARRWHDSRENFPGPPRPRAECCGWHIQNCCDINRTHRTAGGGSVTGGRSTERG